MRKRRSHQGCDSARLCDCSSFVGISDCEFVQLHARLLLHCLRIGVHTHRGQHTLDLLLVCAFGEFNLRVRRITLHAIHARFTQQGIQLFNAVGAAVAVVSVVAVGTVVGGGAVWCRILVAVAVSIAVPVILAVVVAVTVIEIARIVFAGVIKVFRRGRVRPDAKHAERGTIARETSQSLQDCIQGVSIRLVRAGSARASVRLCARVRCTTVQSMGKVGQNGLLDRNLDRINRSN